MPPFFRYFLRRAVSPMLGCVDFRHPCWAVSAMESRLWLFAAVTADVLLQWFYGAGEWWLMAASAAGLVLFWPMPPRLLMATTQLTWMISLGGLLLVRALDHYLSVEQADWVGSAWQLWGGVALLLLLFRYLRSPKKEWRS